jgi:hypothetical protein
MRNALSLAALVAAALVPGAATATPIGVSESASSIIDVEFWGRRLITSFDPDNPNEDIISYGEPVHGIFEISTRNAPSPNRTSYFLDYDDAVVYGREHTPSGNPEPISFVTSRWLSPLPSGFEGDVSPLPSTVAADGGFADDHVTIGDAVQFRPDETQRDWFVVHDGYSALLSDPDSQRQNALAIQMSSPLDVIQGLGLNQEFEVDLPEGDFRNQGFFVNVIERYVVSFYRFAVDRVSVSTRLVCTP